MMKVLQSKRQVADARAELGRMGASCLQGFPLPLLKRLGVLRGPAVGDWLKSWDVLATLDFLCSRLPRGAAVLDIGCYASEVPVALHKLGFTRVSGADLNPGLQRMPFAEAVEYVNCNFMHTPFDNASFAAITAISVIEHGFDGRALLAEVSRLLEPGGYFLASFDYWPEKIDTTGTTFFDMSWTIFSRREVEQLVVLADEFGLEPVGEAQFDASTAPIRCGGKDYTFGWLALQKRHE
jgi:SAM-dependent methyltransferase